MKKEWTAQDLARLTKTTLVGQQDHIIDGVDALENATKSDASFLANPRYIDLARRSNAGLICTTKAIEDKQTTNYLLCEDPSKTFQHIATLFTEQNPTAFSGIHPSSIVHASSRVGKNVTIGPYAVIDQKVTIEDNVTIGAHSFIGSGVTIGENTLLYPHVTIREGSRLGRHVIIQSGAVIGACGFGYLTDKEGVHHKLEQMGIVILADWVEVGANTTIDRARFKSTYIGKGTKIDNLVQIGHNVRLGKNNIMVSQSGIAGSTRFDDNVYLGGQCGVVGHIKVTKGVQLASRGAFSKSVLKAGAYGGAPAQPLAKHNKEQVHIRQLERLLRRVEELEKRAKT